MQISISAQQSSIAFRNWIFSKDFLNNQVNAIFKGSKGFIWFGTMAGLNRYDGYKFRVLKHDLRDSTSINDDFITKIAHGPTFFQGF